MNVRMCHRSLTILTHPLLRRSAPLLRFSSGFRCLGANRCTRTISAYRWSRESSLSPLPHRRDSRSCLCLHHNISLGDPDSRFSGHNQPASTYGKMQSLMSQVDFKAPIAWLAKTEIVLDPIPEPQSCARSPQSQTRM
jgi:hypothetical protein